MMAWSAAALVLLVASCTPPEGFQCASAVDCDRSNDGRCEPTNVCSYADRACPSGRRYGEHAGTLSRTCVVSAEADGGIESGRAVDAAAPIDGLVAYWPLDLDGSDATGRGHHADLIASPALVAGHRGMAFQFNGTNLMRVPSLARAAFPATGTLAMWIDAAFAKPENMFDGYDYSRAHLMLRLIQRTNEPIELQLACQLATGTGGPYAAFVEVPILAGWHHFVITWDTSSTAPALRFYIDGFLRGEDNITGGWLPSDQTVSFMHYFAGTLDEARLYDRVLGEAEIEALP